MRRYLVKERGIPQQAIVRDEAGLHSYDTCVRVRKVFGVNSATVISQDYHEPRIVATCRMVGVDAHGVSDASQVHDSVWRKGWLREFGSRAKMMWDVTTRRDPILGPPDDSVRTAVERHG